LDHFVGLSEALTALGSVITQDYPNLKEMYLRTLLDNTHGPYLGQAEALLQWYAKLHRQGWSPEGIAHTILNAPPASRVRQSQLARSIMSMWYLGIWHDPADPPAVFGVISAQAYINGQAWRLAKAHPQGFSTLFYGHWGSAPPQRS